MTSTRTSHSNSKEVAVAVTAGANSAGTTKATRITRIDRVAVAVVKATIGSAGAAVTSNHITMRIGRRPVRIMVEGEAAAAATTGSATISRIAKQVVSMAEIAPPPT